MSLTINDAPTYRLLVPYAASELAEWANKHDYPIEVAVQARIGVRIPLSIPPRNLSASMQEVGIRGRCRSNVYSPPPGLEVSWFPQRLRYGWYKRQGFDTAFTAMKGLIPTLTEYELASFQCCSWCASSAAMNQPHPELAESRLWGGSEGCIHEYSEEVYPCPEYYDFWLVCPQVELDQRLDTIKEWVEQVQGDLLPRS